MKPGKEEVTLFDQVGAILFFVGFLIEALGDHQLNQYLEVKEKAKEEGRKVPRFCQSGLWKYTRHPNYFGEVVLWWGIYVITLSTPNSVGGHIKNVLSPILINLLLRFVSGVPFLERKFMKDEEFREYAQRTPIFIPGIPKAKVEKKDE